MILKDLDDRYVIRNDLLQPVLVLRHDLIRCSYFDRSVADSSDDAEVFHPTGGAGARKTASGRQHRRDPSSSSESSGSFPGMEAQAVSCNVLLG